MTGLLRKRLLLAACTVVFLGQAPGAAGQQDPIDEELLDILTHGAWVQAATAVCTHDAPGMSGHLLQAYEDWLERNATIRRALKALRGDSDRSLPARVVPSTA